MYSWVLWSQHDHCILLNLLTSLYYKLSIDRLFPLRRVSSISPIPVANIGIQEICSEGRREEEREEERSHQSMKSRTTYWPLGVKSTPLPGCIVVTWQVKRSFILEMPYLVGQSQETQQNMSIAVREDYNQSPRSHMVPGMGLTLRA